MEEASPYEMGIMHSVVCSMNDDIVSFMPSDEHAQHSSTVQDKNTCEQHSQAEDVTEPSRNNAKMKRRKKSVYRFDYGKQPVIHAAWEWSERRQQEPQAREQAWMQAKGLQNADYTGKQSMYDNGSVGTNGMDGDENSMLPAGWFANGGMLCEGLEWDIECGDVGGDIRLECTERWEGVELALEQNGEKWGGGMGRPQRLAQSGRGAYSTEGVDGGADGMGVWWMEKGMEGLQPSRFCHICLRRAERVAVMACGRLRSGGCRKVVCERCFAEFGYDWEGAVASGARWTCTHCRQV